MFADPTHTFHSWREFIVKKYLMALLLTVIVSIATGCSTTNIVVSWQDNLAPAYTLKQPLVIAIVPKQIIRARVEDEFVNSLRLSGVNAVASYRLFPEMQSVTVDSVKAKIPSTGCDSIIVTRLVDTKQETVVVPPTTSVYGGAYGGPGYYGSFDSYYARSYSVVTTPGYSYVEKFYKVETNLYSVKDSKLVWTAVSETEDSESMDAAIVDFVKVIMKDLRKGKIF
jgi:hypothetical protein